MGSQDKGIGIVPCYIGKTRYSAGIFLSKEIGRRKPYGKHLEFEEFANYRIAAAEFERRYPETMTTEEFVLNKLFRVKPESLFSVYWTCVDVVITPDYNSNVNIRTILPDDWHIAWAKHYLTYDEAQAFARARFLRYYKDGRLYIPFKMRVNIPVNLGEVIEYNKKFLGGKDEE